jgi:hypothetical protein
MLVLKIDNWKIEKLYVIQDHSNENQYLKCVYMFKI